MSLFDTTKGLAVQVTPKNPNSVQELARRNATASRELNAAVSESTVDVVFTENVAAGLLVNTYDNSGTLAARAADASFPDRYADGFIETDVTAGDTATVRLVGRNILLSGLTPGTTYYLSTAGTVATSPAAYSQIVGRSLSTTELWFHPERK